MRSNKSAIFIIILAVIFLGFFNVKEAQTKLDVNVPQDVSSDSLKALVIEDFETNTDWQVVAEPKQNPDPKKNPVPVLELKYVDGGPSDLEPEKWSPNKKGLEKKKCLGVHFRFKYPGYNKIHILPPPEVRHDDPGKAVMTYDPGTGTEIRERAIQIPGQAKGLSIWVHGRGNDYYLEAWVKDWTGEVHILPFGSTNFVGWRPLKASIPPYVPQAIESYPQTKVLKIVRFVVRAAPTAIVEDVYMFFDQIKALTDTYEVNFDGQELHKAFEQKTSSTSSK